MNKAIPKLDEGNNASVRIKRNGNTVRNPRKLKLDATQGVEKRKRSSNFHSKEIEELLCMIDSEKSIIECKRTDQLTNACKDKTWKRISHIFNQKNTTKRSDKQLRSKWETLKKIARKEYAAGCMSTVSNNVLKIMLSCNDSELRFTSQEAPRLKEEPYFDCNIDQNLTEDSQDWNTVVDLDIFQPKPESQSQRIINSTEISGEVVNTTPPTNVFDNLELIHIDQPGSSSETIETSSEAMQSEVCSTTKSTQYECQSSRSTPKRKKLRFVHSNCQNFGRIIFREENKRKREKHRLEMEILRIELAIKKKQLEKICE